MKNGKSNIRYFSSSTITIKLGVVRLKTVRNFAKTLIYLVHKTDVKKKITKKKGGNTFSIYFQLLTYT